MALPGDRLGLSTSGTGTSSHGGGGGYPPSGRQINQPSSLEEVVWPPTIVSMLKNLRNLSAFLVFLSVASLGLASEGLYVVTVIMEGFPDEVDDDDTSSLQVSFGINHTEKLAFEQVLAMGVATIISLPHFLLVIAYCIAVLVFVKKLSSRGGRVGTATKMWTSIIRLSLTTFGSMLFNATLLVIAFVLCVTAILHLRHVTPCPDYLAPTCNEFGTFTTAGVILAVSFAFPAAFPTAVLVVLLWRVKRLKEEIHGVEDLFRKPLMNKKDGTWKEQATSRQW
mmetsp:Transcript_39185/g.100395  ORF Transcript_39185/g.100395 Transcript_39185/m.100395 type:complete len:281 (-) Transcript_39185:1-843(-)